MIPTGAKAVGAAFASFVTLAMVPFDLGTVLSVLVAMNIAEIGLIIDHRGRIARVEARQKLQNGDSE